MSDDEKLIADGAQAIAEAGWSFTHPLALPQHERVALFRAALAVVKAG